MSTFSEWIASQRAELERATGNEWRMHIGPHTYIETTDATIAEVVLDDLNSNGLSDGRHIVSAHNAYGALLAVAEAAYATIYREGQNWLDSNEYMERLRTLRAALDELFPQDHPEGQS